MRKSTFVVCAAISLFAASGHIAHAGEVISDQRYWPNEASDQRTSPNDAYGYYYAGRARPGLYAPGYEAMASMNQAPVIGPAFGSSFTYRGGPKTGTRDYTRQWE